jgi:hypothetical protein
MLFALAASCSQSQEDFSTADFPAGGCCAKEVHTKTSSTVHA